MTLLGLAQILIYFVILIAITKPVGAYYVSRLSRASGHFFIPFFALWNA